MEDRALFPGGASVAVSLTFDDARDSQLDVALPVLEEHGVPATFYVLPEPVRHRVDEWRALVARDHEIGNHTVTHPCSGNFGFSRGNALESFTVERMETEIDHASSMIEALLGVRPSTFAYPCGQSFVGRGATRQSYVPVVARRFVAARGYGSETANDPWVCDLAHLEAFTVDGLDGDALAGLARGEHATGRWVVMAGHDVGDGGEQTVVVRALDALCRHLLRPYVWCAPVGEVATYLRQLRNRAQQPRTSRRDGSRTPRPPT